MYTRNFDLIVDIGKCTLPKFKELLLNKKIILEGTDSEGKFIVNMLKRTAFTKARRNGTKQYKVLAELLNELDLYVTQNNIKDDKIDNAMKDADILLKKEYATTDSNNNSTMTEKMKSFE